MTPSRADVAAIEQILSNTLLWGVAKVILMMTIISHKKASRSEAFLPEKAPALCECSAIQLRPTTVWSETLQSPSQSVFTKPEVWWNH
jgi:hypothetical protein